MQTRETAAVQTRLAEHQEPPAQIRAVPAAERGQSASVRVRDIGDLRAAITHPRLSRASGTLFALQRALGNRALREAMSRARQASGPAPVAQPRLVIGPADDRYERAADRIAREAGRRVAQQPTGQGGHGAHRPPAIQRMATARGSAVGNGLRQAIGQARGGGQPVPAELRGSMERAFGADFSRVRLHADPRADRFNRTLQARAFTIGRDIFFRRGDYNPGSVRGRQLLAHELTHVVQQGGIPISPD